MPTARNLHKKGQDECAGNASHRLCLMRKIICPPAEALLLRNRQIGYNKEYGARQ
jgi:hypothetical protein